MRKSMRHFESVEEYMASFPPEIQVILEKVRQTIKTVAPEARETISYGMPTYKQKRVLVHFGAQKTHLGFYPKPSGIEAFKEELADYDTSRGTIRFPWGNPMPYDLIMRIVEYRVAEESSK